jgi:hypothetical protein
MLALQLSSGQTGSANAICYKMYLQNGCFVEMGRGKE